MPIRNSKRRDGRDGSASDPFEKVFSQPDKLQRVIADLFEDCARDSHPHKGIPVMHIQHTEMMIKSLARAFDIQTKLWGRVDPTHLFWRFDFNGDGLLEEFEVQKMCVCLLRQYRDASNPHRPGSTKLGGVIRNEPVSNSYELGKQLGKGGQGCVYIATSKVSNRKVVVKFYDKSCANAPVEDITDEFELMMKLKHPRIAHYFDIFQDHANIYVVTEPYYGGDLTTAVKKAGEAKVKVTERWQSGIFNQVIQGISYLHSNWIMHCDMKEANVMIASADAWDHPQVVVIDFGLANSFITRTGCSGTPGYMPPEVWEAGMWTPRGDIFSIGVMIFKMRSGENPFVDGAKKIDDVKKFTCTKVAKLSTGSPIVKALVDTMLAKKIQDRPAIQRVEQSEWLRAASAELTVDSKVLKVLLEKRHASDLQKAFLRDFAARQNISELRELNDLFMNLDKDNSGTLTPDEIEHSLRGAWPDHKIKELLSILGDGEVGYEEFLGQLMAAREPHENRFLSQVFEELDTNKKGYIDKYALAELAKRPAISLYLGGANVMDFMSDLDSDNNGKVTFSEFKRIMQLAPPKALLFPRRGGGKPVVPREGDCVQFYSESAEKWLDTEIIRYDEKRQAIQVACKAGFWIKGEMRNRVRYP